MWIICPECHNELREPVQLRRMVGLRCPACRRRFRAYVGDALLFVRRRHPEDITYYVLLSGSVVPRLFVIRDETLDEIMISRGDRVAVVYRGERPTIVQNLSLSTYWVIHDMSPLGCLASLACVLAAAIAASALVTLLR
jgi:hypothetical protein